MKGYLIDTDWIADYLKGKSYARQSLSSLLRDGMMAVSIITYAELHEGVVGSSQRETRVRDLSELIKAVKLLGIDRETAEVFANERYRLRKQGRLLDNFDLLIAATALRNGLPLVTNNVAHYERVRDLRVLSEVTR